MGSGWKPKRYSKQMAATGRYGHTHTADFKPKKVTRVKDGHYKGDNNQKDIIIINIYTPNTGALKYVKATINIPKRRN